MANAIRKKSSASKKETKIREELRVISLNIWGGHLFEPLMDFVEKHSKSTDVFCFQEVLSSTERKPFNISSSEIIPAKSDIYFDLKRTLRDFDAYLAVSQHDDLGLATFIRKGIMVQQVEDVFVYRKRDSMIRNERSTLGRNVLHTKIIVNGRIYSIFNFHGLWWPNIGKIDIPERIEQSKKLREVVVSSNSPKILCGDFNLDPNTESLKILEIGMENLIKKYKITTTRSAFYKKNDRFADYTLVSKEVKVKNFKVLPDAVSDHLAMQLDFK